MSRIPRQWTPCYFIWAIIFGLSIILFSSCTAPNAGGPSVFRPIQTPLTKIATIASTPQPTVVPSPTPSKLSISCTGYYYDQVCIIDPLHLLIGQPVAPDVITPMIKDMAMSVTTGTITVSQEYGILHLTILEPNDSGDNTDYCRQLIFLALSVTESDYLFQNTNITCQAGIITLHATLTAKTSKKINWNTQLTVDEESLIAWNQYDTHYETK